MYNRTSVPISHYDLSCIHLSSSQHLSWKHIVVVRIRLLGLPPLQSHEEETRTSNPPCNLREELDGIDGNGYV